MAVAERRRLPFVYVRFAWHVEAPHRPETMCGLLTTRGDLRTDRPMEPACPSCDALSAPPGEVT